MLTIASLSGHGHDHYGHSDGRRQHPDENVDHLSLDWRPELQSSDWVANGNIAVYAHHSEGEDACEHVVVVNSDNELAQDLAERPCIHQVFGALEGQRAGGQGVG